MNRKKAGIWLGVCLFLWLSVNRDPAAYSIEFLLLGDVAFLAAIVFLVLLCIGPRDERRLIAIEKAGKRLASAENAGNTAGMAKAHRRLGVLYGKAGDESAAVGHNALSVVYHNELDEEVGDDLARLARQRDRLGSRAFRRRLREVLDKSGTKALLDVLDEAYPDDPKPSRPAVGQHPVEVHSTMPYRVSWPPGYADGRPIRQVNNAQGLYLIEPFDSRTAAIEFLRGCEVRDERVYVIAETPHGNLGKDLIMIFAEEDGAFVEIGRRSALSSPTFSREDCARCGYAVIPAAEPFADTLTADAGSVHMYLNLETMEANGTGFQCESCGGLACAQCYRATLGQPTSGGPLDLRCWLCDDKVDLFTQ